jgi:hypothetical protein
MIEGKKSDIQITYTQEQMDIALLKNTNEGLLRCLSEIKTEAKSSSKWIIALLIGLYAINLDWINGIIALVAFLYALF